MKKRRLAAILILTAIVVSGCAETPDSTVVREKSGISTEKYQEDETAGISLKERLNVPETYQTSVNLENETLEVACNAKIEIPEVKKVPVYRVEPVYDIEAEKIAKAFFGDTPVYDGDLYFQRTKEEILGQLNELKGYQTAGNTDPYGVIAKCRENGVSEEDLADEEVYDIRQEIDALEEAYEAAPEQVERKKCPLVLNTPLDWPDDGGEAAFFHGAVEMGESVFDYGIQSIRDSGLYMDVTVSRKDRENPTVKRDWFLLGSEDGDKSVRLTKEEAEDLAGITPEEAIAAADVYMEKLGLTDFSAKNTSLGVCGTYGEGNEGSIRFDDAGYYVYYTRDVDGIPVTKEDTYSSDVEDSDTTLQSWIYEDITFCINKEGLQNASILNLYNIGEKMVTNLKMLDFSEIQGIFEKMVQIRYAPMEGVRFRKLIIDRVTFGYMRIYDPGSENRSGLLIPVWDFFGTMEYQYDNGNEFVYAGSTSSWLTINAADGTVINRSYGY